MTELDSHLDSSGSRELSPVDMAHSGERVLDFKTKSRENVKPFKMIYFKEMNSTLSHINKTSHKDSIFIFKWFPLLI